MGQLYQAEQAKETAQKANTAQPDAVTNDLMAFGQMFKQLVDQMAAQGFDVRMWQSANTATNTPAVLISLVDFNMCGICKTPYPTQGYCGTCKARKAAH